MDAHQNEDMVAKIMAMPNHKQSFEFEKICLVANYKFNVDVIDKGKGELNFLRRLETAISRVSTVLALSTKMNFRGM